MHKYNYGYTRVKVDRKTAITHFFLSFSGFCAGIWHCFVVSSISGDIADTIPGLPCAMPRKADADHDR